MNNKFNNSINKYKIRINNNKYINNNNTYFNNNNIFQKKSWRNNNIKIKNYKIII